MKKFFILNLYYLPKAQKQDDMEKITTFSALSRLLQYSTKLQLDTEAIPE
jgi:hypothetical protein